MNRRRKGFTLVELQVVLVIAIIIFSAVLAIYLFSWRSFTVGNALLDVYASSRNASGWIMRDIRSATQVVSNHDGWSTTDNSIVLMVPSIDADGEIIDAVYDYVIYALQGTDLRRVVDADVLSARPDQNSIIANDCTDLIFSSDGTGLSDIANLSTVNTISIYLPINKSTVSLGGAAASGEASISPTTLVRLRNK